MPAEVDNDLSAPIAIKGADECEQTVSDAHALDLAFIQDSHDGGYRFWTEIQNQYARVRSQGETGGGST